MPQEGSHDARGGGVGKVRGVVTIDGCEAIPGLAFAGGWEEGEGGGKERVRVGVVGEGGAVCGDKGSAKS